MSEHIAAEIRMGNAVHVDLPDHQFVHFELLINPLDHDALLYGLIFPADEISVEIDIHINHLLHMHERYIYE
ncbi:hypothetical protein D3C78_1777940 [compost metagenome]